MVPDLDFVSNAFQRFNTEIFEGKLPRPKFTLTRARTFQGKMVYRIKRTGKIKMASDFDLRISVSFDLPESEWEDVVIHEMIHLHIAAGAIEDSSSHGPVFRRLMHSINRLHSRNVTVSARNSAEKATEQNADKRTRPHYVCIGRFSDGRLGIAPVAKTRVFQLWDFKKFFPQLSEVRWIGTIDPYFNSFPHVQSPKLYIVKEEDLKGHLNGAMPLEKAGRVIKVAVSQRCSPDELLP